MKGEFFDFVLGILIISIFYKIKLFAHLYKSAIASQTAGLNGLTFLMKPMDIRGVK